MFTFRRLAGGCLQVFTTYAHTWSYTTINSFSVSNGGFGISFSSAADRWQKASGAGKLGC